MKYYFEAGIEKKDADYVIPIPFNIWEVCKQRDVIIADVILDNQIIECKLFPKEKGNYEIHLEEEVAKGLAHITLHKVLLHIRGSLVVMDQDSPYSLKNPVRKIDHVEVIIQPEDGLCGQTCVAMLAGVTIEDVMEVTDCREWQATMGRVISALNYYGIDHSDTIIYTEGRDAKLPKCCIMMEKMGRFCHYLVYFDGKYYDSNLGVIEEYDMGKLLGYLEIRL
ncbi:DUF1905 domain-containing protein [Lachnospiraceae bacterium OttesenSCG-928-D06]|nr:DUF1905 domain-containing protein [Lachnospiraceae bacterium OttesenSCG-928-D06]